MFHVSCFMFHVSCFMFHVSCFMFTDEIAEHNQTEAHEQMVIIASEPLTDEDDFKEIPPNRIPTIFGF